ncbi:MAG TPA: SagB family peptide dehydrogenase [Blastocatellia bacterium]|nr:SagB family peptide dehydrogenase [Blastocatellia bacterium]
MTRQTWNDLRLAPGDPGLVWELFHENSKTNRYDAFPSEQETLALMSAMWESLPFEGYPIVELPRSPTPLGLSLEEALTARVTTRELEPCSLTLEQVATLLHYAYGVTRDNRGTAFPRPFRIVPSAGALYPLEVFFFSAHVDGLQTGLYHYNPARNDLRFVREGDERARLSEALVQSYLAAASSVIFFITAMFERTTSKYADRGYRFVMMEAGHLAQNMNLVATALGLGSVNIGGFFDRQVDALLGLDGLTHSAVYLVCVGKSVISAGQESEEERHASGRS